MRNINQHGRKYTGENGLKATLNTPPPFPTLYMGEKSVAGCEGKREKLVGLVVFPRDYY